MKQILVLLIFILPITISCHPARESLNIIQIDLKSNGECEGTCLAFSLTIYNDGRALYIPDKLSNSTQLQTFINKEKMDSISQLISIQNIWNLQETYTNPRTDLPTYTLTIRLKNDSSKTITDYGPSGPEALKKVYARLLSLKQSQEWRPVN
ncbi:MAG: hypothetical protein J0I41_21860 [Filimonas sp.]|nr:hypothetical protein [Filimonas sp.]